MKKLCDKCKMNPAIVSYTETVNGKTRHLELCEECAGFLVEEKSRFLDSFLSLDPFREIDQMFDSMFGRIGFEKQFIKAPSKQTAPTKNPQTPTRQKKQSAPPRLNTKEEKLKELKKKLDELKQEEAIAVMVQDYMKAAEIKKKREKIQKEAEKIINQ